MTKDPYEILGVAPGASQEDIKKAYRRKTKEYHPDLHPDDPTAGEKMAEVNAAYDRLQNPEKYAADQRREEAQRQYSQQQGYQHYSQNGGYTYYTYTYDPYERYEEDERADDRFYGFRRSSPVTFSFFPFFGILRWIFYINAIGWFLRLIGGLFLR
ncbi:MAG: J domain-containing protein [Oscillospiraceae bacterium]|nr:J domain-containing protein [Oscillospiraceae bacterium]